MDLVAAPLGLYAAGLVAHLPAGRTTIVHTGNRALSGINSCLRIAWLPRLAELAAINWAFFLDEAPSPGDYASPQALKLSISPDSLARN